MRSRIRVVPRFDICDQCAVTLGVFEVGPPRRPAVPCTRCNGMQFVRVIPREKGTYAISSTDDRPTATIEPMALAYAPQRRRRPARRTARAHAERGGPARARHPRELRLCELRLRRVVLPRPAQHPARPRVHGRTTSTTPRSRASKLLPLAAAQHEAEREQRQCDRAARLGAGRAATAVGRRDSHHRPPGSV